MLSSAAENWRGHHWRDAIDNYNKLFKCGCTEIKDSAGEIYKYLGYSYRQLGLYDSAAYIFDQGLKYIQEDIELLRYAAENAEKLDKFESDTDIFIKPEEDGSSVDVFKISNEQEFTEAIENCSNRNRPFIIEECIDYKEITVPILNGKCLPPIEIITKESFYNYAAKYVNDDTKLIEAKFSSNLSNMLESICIDTYTLMECEGWARIDLLQRADESFYVMEVNTVPGMTSHSLFPKSAAIIGLDYNSLVEEIINAK